jgi:hypothetical protein
MSERRTLFTIRESQNFTRELWDRFAAKAADEGHSPVAVLRRLIETYLTRPPHDTTTPKGTPGT